MSIAGFSLTRLSVILIPSLVKRQCLSLIGLTTPLVRLVYMNLPSRPAHFAGQILHSIHISDFQLAYQDGNCYVIASFRVNIFLVLLNMSSSRDLLLGH